MMCIYSAKTAEIVARNLCVKLIEPKRLFAFYYAQPVKSNGTDAMIVPFIRQIEQLHLRRLTIPSGKASSRTTSPQ